MWKSKGFYDYAWNPVMGCHHACWYCIAKEHTEGRGLMQDFTAPQFYPKRIDEPRSVRDKIIMTVAYGDLFGEWVPAEWIESVLKVIRETPRNTYVLLTKNPERYDEFDLPANVYAGTTVEDQSKMFRAHELLKLKNKKLLSIEPIMGDFTGVDFSPYDAIVAGYMIGRPITVTDKQNMKSINSDKLYKIVR